MKIIKDIVGTICFFLVGLLIFMGVGSVLGTDEEYSEMMFQGYYAEQENIIDAVFIGNSHIYKFWQPAFAWEEYGMASTELATSSMPGCTMKNVAIEALKTQSPKVIVIDITPFANIDKENNKVHLLLDNMKFSKNRLDLVENFCKFTNVEGMDKMQYYFPIMQFHSRWKELTNADFTQTRPSYLNSNYQKTFMKKLKEDVEHPTTEEREKIGEQNEAALLDLLEWCKNQKDVDFQFLAVPVVREKNLGRMNYVGDIVKEYGFDFVNYNEEGMFEIFDFNVKKDFEDVNHTNINGSYKFTKVYGEYLIERYGLADHRGESPYDSWDGKAEKYHSKIDKYFIYAEEKQEE